MRILYYHRQALAQPSGASALTIGWAQALARAGAEVSLGVDPSISERPPPEGVSVRDLRHAGRGGLVVPLDIARAARDVDVVVLQAGWHPPNNYIARRVRAAGVPYVVDARGVYIRPIVAKRRRLKRLWWSAFEYAYLRDALAVHLYFSDEVVELNELAGAVRTIVVRCGFEGPDEHHASRPRSNTGGYLLWLGRFDVHHKGLDLLLDAVELLAPEDRPVIKLHGPDWEGGKRELRRSIESRGLGRWLRPGPFVAGDDKWGLLAGASGFVYPSRFEPFGVSVAEAAWAGLPLLLTPFPLARSLAADDAATVVDPTPEALAEGLRRVSSPGDMGARAARVMRERFSWDVAARSWLREVNALLQQGS